MKLTACDNKSIEYARILEISKMRVGESHECNCDFCETETSWCPECGCEEYEEVRDYDEWVNLWKRGILRCCDCDTVYLRNMGVKFYFRAALEELEKLSK